MKQDGPREGKEWIARQLGGWLEYKGPEVKDGNNALSDQQRSQVRQKVKSAHAMSQGGENQTLFQV